MEKGDWKNRLLCLLDDLLLCKVQRAISSAFLPLSADEIAAFSWAQDLTGLFIHRGDRVRPATVVWNWDLRCDY